MMRPIAGLALAAISTAVFFTPERAGAQAAAGATGAGAPAATVFSPPPNLPRADANGNPIRFAPRTGHVSNYDEAKVAPYTLPDPLVMADGTAVKDADTWMNKRRPEILKLYQENIYGRILPTAAKVTWVAATDAWNPAVDVPLVPALNGAAVVKHALVHCHGSKLG